MNWGESCFRGGQLGVGDLLGPRFRPRTLAACGSLRSKFSCFSAFRPPAPHGLPLRPPFARAPLFTFRHCHFAFPILSTSSSVGALCVDRRVRKFRLEWLVAHGSWLMAHPTSNGSRINFPIDLMGDGGWGCEMQGD